MSNGADYPQNVGAQPSVPKVALQEYVDARFAAIADTNVVAEGEREKAAASLRLTLEREIETGDERLRDHIVGQVEAIKAALLSADLLERERISLTHEEVAALENAVTNLFAEKQKALDAALIAQKEAVAEAKVATDRIAIRSTTDQEGLRADMQERLAAVRRELEQATAAQKEAVLKAETANEKRFQAVDEWKAAAAERERSQLDTQTKLIGQFMPREVAEAQSAELRRLTDSHYRENAAHAQALQERLDKQQGSASGGRTEREDARSDASLKAQIQSLRLMVGGLLSGGAFTVIAALITHGFK